MVFGLELQNFLKKSENSHKFSGFSLFSLLFVEFIENFVHYKKKKEMLMNDFRIGKYRISEKLYMSF